VQLARRGHSGPSRQRSRLSGETRFDISHNVIATLRSTQVNRAQSTPLHDQIRRIIRSQIASGRFRPGDRVPTEHEYAKQFQVSLAPVRQALLDLVASGLVERIKGRGTFVKGSKTEESISLLASFTESLRSQGDDFEMRVLNQEVESASPEVVRALGLRTGGKVVRLRRLAYVRGEPAAILDARLPAARFRRLVTISGFEQSRSLYATLEKDFGTRVGASHGTLEVVRCDEDVADLLGVSEGTHALLVSSVTNDVKGRPVEISAVLYRADRFKFTIDTRAMRRR
jgi:GntR family transcriptional regulator